jgi:geranylgeranyl reductase family protein
MVDTDVLVVGAGPAGSAAAITLARAGLRVTVADKATFPRDKCCGDGLTTAALRLLEHLGLDPTNVPSWTVVSDVVVRSPSGREVHLPLPRGAGQFSAVARRVELDAALVALARSVGAVVHEGRAVHRVDHGADDVEIGFHDGGRLRANYVVAADGMWSPTRAALGVGPQGYRGEWQALRHYLTGVTGPAADRQYVWFESDVLPGYVWSFPLTSAGSDPGTVNFGFGVPRQGSAVHSGRDAARLWATLLARPHICAALGDGVVPQERHLGWPIPCRIDRAVLAHGRVLFAGDAAAAADVMTGEGIAQALLTGTLAARAIADGGPGDVGVVAAAYRAAVRRALLADHRLSVVLGRVLRSDRGARGALKVVDHTSWTRRNVARWMFEDEPRAVAFTPRRWHRMLLRRPGAYADATLPDACAPD